MKKVSSVFTRVLSVLALVFSKNNKRWFIALSLSIGFIGGFYTLSQRVIADNNLVHDPVIETQFESTPFFLPIVLKSGLTATPGNTATPTPTNTATPTPTNTHQYRHANTHQHR
jgi:hypothetical protein